MLSAGAILDAAILVVDDRAANVELLVRMLRNAGYTRVSSTTRPEEVCPLHVEHRFDLILLDLHMAGMDGFAVMEALKQIEPEGYLPVLVVTAQPETKLRALRAGARDFVSKPFDFAEVLMRVRNLVEVRLLQRETARLYGRVLIEQRLSERLLRNVLPASITERLKGQAEIADGPFPALIADEFDDVTVLFADIVNFTRFAERVGAAVLVGVLNDLFGRFDQITQDRGLEKIKTIGDAYMAAAGLPVPAVDHPERAADVALDMIDAMAAFNADSPYALDVRIGIDTGPAVAGVIGRRRFQYDLWGDVVNTASRMESEGIAGRIQLTERARGRLGPRFVTEPRGLVTVKGKGPMRTWFLVGRHAA